MISVYIWEGRLHSFLIVKSEGGTFQGKTTVFSMQADDSGEERFGLAGPDWPDWHAEYMVREHSG
jgi:hypothetical protein